MTIRTRESLGQAIAAARLAAGVSQERLGAQTDLGQTAISRIEGGLRRVESLELLRIAEALKLDIAVLLEGSGAAPDPEGSAEPADYEWIALRLDEEHPGHARALAPAVQLLERLTYLQELVGDMTPNDRHWDRR